jgi:hypothetical protein
LRMRGQVTLGQEWAIWSTVWTMVRWGAKLNLAELSYSKWDSKELAMEKHGDTCLSSQ